MLPPFAIAALSLVVLCLVLAHRRANLGGGAMLAFLLSAAAYGWVRSLAIRWLSDAHLGEVPYHLERPLAAVAGVPLQELLGWISAAGLAAYFADRLLRRGLGSANAWSTALVAGVGMAAICLAVESAAVTAGWWSWNLGHATSGALRFPAIALLDWGFVALDLLLPFELWRRRAPLGERLAGLLFFPLHLAGHAVTTPLSSILPFSGFDLVHVGLVAAAAAVAVRARDRSAWPASAGERWRLAPLVATAVLLATTSAQLLLLGEAELLWTGVPLALAAWTSWRVSVAAPTAERPPPSAARTALLFATLLLGGLSLLLPAAIRRRDFEQDLSRGIAALSAGDLAGARASLAAALRRRPAHPDVAWLLGWTELQAGARVAARAHLEAAVAQRLAAVEAVRYLALLDIGEGRGAEASALLAQRRGRHRETGDLAYLAWAASAGSTRQDPVPAELLAATSEAELREIFALARALGDGPTMQACRVLDLDRASATRLAPPKR
ncbi:MAG: hypothetical protein ABIU84_15045 [Thermoanaerobaculia bacterium]